MFSFNSCFHQICNCKHIQLSGSIFNYLDATAAGKGKKILGKKFRVSTQALSSAERHDDDDDDDENEVDNGTMEPTTPKKKHLRKSMCCFC